jgi:hypothetical protein
LKKDQEVVIMTKEELDDLVYYSAYRAASKACSNLFHGLVPFIDRLSEDHEKMINVLDYIKVSVNESNPLNETKGKTEPEKSNLQNLSDKFFGNMTDEQRANLSKAIKEQISTNNLIHNQVPLPKLPDLRKD